MPMIRMIPARHTKASARAARRHSAAPAWRLRGGGSGMPGSALDARARLVPGPAWSRPAPPAVPQVVHFIRHGEGFHNVAGHANPEEYK